MAYLGRVTIETANARQIDALALATRSGWPDDLRVLIARYPRDVWQTHVNLGDMARFWLSRHDMFRELSAAVGTIMSDFRAGQVAPAEFARQFVPRLQFLLNQLDLHHQIEDFHYFPIFKAAEARLSLGFEVLEGDHDHIHRHMARTAEAANTLLASLHAGDGRLRRCSDEYAATSAALLQGLARHLDDEEDLVVPLILDRGEDELGVSHHR